MGSGDPVSVRRSLTMLLFRYAGSDTAKRVNAEAGTKNGSHAGGKAKGSHAAVETELLLRTDPGGRRHVVSPTAGAWACGKGAIVGWGVFCLAAGLIAGFGANGGFFGAVKGGVVTGIIWAIFGLGAGALYGLWAGRAVSGRRLNAIGPILPPDTSMVLAWAEGTPKQQAVIPWSDPASQQLALRFNEVPHGAVLQV